MLSEHSVHAKAIPPKKLNNSPGVFIDRIKQKCIKKLYIFIEQNPHTYSKLKYIIQWIATLFTLALILFIALICANTIVFGKPLKFDDAEILIAKSSMMTCRNTKQGKTYITDDKGYVCKHNYLDPTTGCCREQGKRPYTCPKEHCNTTSSCCSIYEYCVSCCMDPSPSKEKIRQAVLDSTNDPIILSYRKDVFELCRSVCRTSSKSLVSQNQYRNDEIKHCFGASGPPLLNETESGQRRLRTSGHSDMPSPPPPLDYANSDEEAILEPTFINGQTDNVMYTITGVSNARTSGSIRLNAANAFRVVLLTILLLQLLIPLELEKRTKTQ